jgi:NADPH:quinone reductase-like Zn-dependent oxidoreductase|nr:zinc-binding dehydrogenase [Pseudomonas sp. DR48]
MPTPLKQPSSGSTLNGGRQWLLTEGEAGQLKPIIAKTFPFEQIVEAHRYVESNQQFGKIVVTVSR